MNLLLPKNALFLARVRSGGLAPPLPRNRTTCWKYRRKDCTATIDDISVDNPKHADLLPEPRGSHFDKSTLKNLLTADSGQILPFFRRVERNKSYSLHTVFFKNLLTAACPLIQFE